MNPDQQITILTAKLKKLGNAKWGLGAKRYLKSPFEFFGVNSPGIKQIVKEFKAKNKNIARSELWALTEKLWQLNWHEHRLLALKFLGAWPDYLDAKVLPRLEKMLRTSVNWDQVDEICGRLLAPVWQKDFTPAKALRDAARPGAMMRKYLLAWSKDKNFWLRRASLLSQGGLFRRGLGDKKLFFRLAAKMFDENRYPRNYFTSEIFAEKMGKFFIRKATGWVLRDLSLSDPEAVVKFLNQYQKQMSPLTWREASRRLPSQYKKQSQSRNF